MGREELYRTDGTLILALASDLPSYRASGTQRDIRYEI